MNTEQPRKAKLLAFYNKFMHRLQQKVLRWLVRYVQIVSKQHGYILLATFLLTAGSAYYSYRLFQDVRTDFATLLPETDRSVRHLKKIIDRTGGIGSLFITISSPDFEANKKLMTELAGRIRQMPNDYINYLEYNTNEVEGFLRQYGLYYLDIEDLQKVRNLLKDHLAKARLAATGMLLDDSPDPIAKKEIQTLLNKYTSKNPYAKFPEGYFGTSDGTTLVMVLQPRGSTNDFTFCQNMVAALRQEIKASQPASFHQQMEVGMTGTYVGLLESFASVINDALTTAGLSVVLIFLIIFIYYKNLRMIFILAIAILAGITWTFALTFFKIGYLNQQTAFLGSIIVGNGINFGLIMMARYLEERTAGVNIHRSNMRAVIKTMSATFMAALAASLAYGILSFTHFQGFAQFGFIGGIGMAVCWLASYLIIPPLLVLSEKILPLRVKKPDSCKVSYFSYFMNFVHSRFSRQIFYLTLFVLLPLGLILSYQYAKNDQFEYNLRNLVNRSSHNVGSEAYFGKKVEQVFGNGTIPAVMLAKTPEEANRFSLMKQAEIEADRAAGRENNIDRIQWMGEVLPSRQEEKARIIRQMRSDFQPKYLELLSGQEKAWGKMTLQMISHEPFRLADMPVSMTRAFVEKDQTAGRLVFVTASNNLDMSNVKDLFAFGQDVQKNLPLDNDEVILASESMIFLDIVRNISEEGPMVTVISFILVGLLVLLGTRQLFDFAMIFGFLTMGMLLFIATINLIGMKLNFFNFVVIPMTIGIGVDYIINVYFRYHLEGRGQIITALQRTGGAVVLCSLTTIIGYGVMIIADSQAMASFGLMAIIGEFALLFSALFLMPAFLAFRDRNVAKSGL